MPPAPDASSVNDRIAARVRALRAERGVSLEALAEACGVSRSMISLIERGETSPTAVVLERLATGLGVMLASLFDAPAAAAPADPVSRRAAQQAWRDPASGYLRRNVSPPGSRKAACWSAPYFSTFTSQPKAVKMPSMRCHRPSCTTPSRLCLL